MKKLIINLIIIVHCSLSSNSQAAETAPHPEAMAEQYFYALSDSGISAAASFMHPDARKRFKDMLLPVFELEARSGQRQGIDMFFGETASIEAVTNLTPQAFMRAFLKSLPPQVAGAGISFENIEILGRVHEAEKVHVISRLTVGAGDLSVTQLEVISFAPYKNGWGMLLNGKMDNLIKAIRARALH